MLHIVIFILFIAEFIIHTKYIILEAQYTRSVNLGNGGKGVLQPGLQPLAVQQLLGDVRLMA